MHDRIDDEFCQDFVPVETTATTTGSVGGLNLVPMDEIVSTVCGRIVSTVAQEARGGIFGYVLAHQ